MHVITQMNNQKIRQEIRNRGNENMESTEIKNQDLKSEHINN